MAEGAISGGNASLLVCLCFTCVHRAILVVENVDVAAAVAGTRVTLNAVISNGLRNVSIIARVD